jgi:hypothetical protein
MDLVDSWYLSLIPSSAFTAPAINPPLHFGERGLAKAWVSNCAMVVVKDSMMLAAVQKSFPVHPGGQPHSTTDPYLGQTSWSADRY